jgi:hypothetical protein
MAAHAARSGIIAHCAPRDEASRAGKTQELRDFAAAQRDFFCAIATSMQSREWRTRSLRMVCKRIYRRPDCGHCTTAA